MILQPGPYLSAFQMLNDDFRRVMEYVEPTNTNLTTFSHRLYELLLRACTEFESACRELLVAAGHPKAPKDMSILDYRTLEPTLKLERCEVGILLWQPMTDYVKPFAGWSIAAPPLGWYKAYNNVKHNRNVAFAEANLDNVRLAIAALFALLVADGVIDRDVVGFQQRPAKNQTTIESVFPGYPFSLVTWHPMP